MKVADYFKWLFTRCWFWSLVFITSIVSFWSDAPIFFSIGAVYFSIFKGVVITNFIIFTIIVSFFVGVKYIIKIIIKGESKK